MENRAISEERDPETGTDSARYLAAGAVRSFWVRTRQGQLAEAMPRLRKEFEWAHSDGGNVIVESNSILRFLKPDVYLAVLDPGTKDFKASALKYLDRADAVLLPEFELATPEWAGVSLKLIAGAARLQMRPPEYVTAQIAEFVREGLQA
jgi:hypothetical protein